MAAVLDAFAPYVKKLITEMAQEEVSMLLGVSSEITKLEDNIEGLNAFLADAERRRITDKSVQRWVAKLKNAMYDATDIIDLCQLESDKLRGSKGCKVEEKAPGCLHPLLFCLGHPMLAHRIGSRIKELNQRLQGIHREADKFKFNIGIGSNLEPRKLTIAAHMPSQRMTSEFDESAIVGEKIEKDTKELSQLLVISDKHDIRVVSIVGTGGMGKTTLAQKIFNESTVQQHFKLKIWLSITEHFDEVELLRMAIEHAGGVHGGAQDKTLLIRTLIRTLSMGRFLIVLDDVWSDVAWSHLLNVPLKKASLSQPGSIILITTRLGDLAQQIGASFYQHHVSPLNEQDAWTLLNKQLPLSPNEVEGTDHLKNVGMKIVRKCGGLPLAVKVMGGLLSTRSRSEREWEAVLNHHAWSVAGLPKELDNRMYLSYDDLSPQLKQCFLYCSLFPKGTIIWQSLIIPMWISEGFIGHPAGSSLHDDGLEEIANEYYHELAMRNLIQPVEANRYQCTMHDVVHSFAEFMSKEDSLMVQDQEVAGHSKNSLVRRMSIASSKLVHQEWDVLQKQLSLRTLIINCTVNFELRNLWTSFSRLRVLYIKGGDCDWFVGSLYHLRHLRYLCLDETNISKLPDHIHMMKFLEHIIIRGSKNFENLPRTIVKLEHLRTLGIKDSNDNVVIPKGFGRLTNLRSLYGFPVHMDLDGAGDWCSLEEIGPLSRLRDLTLHGLENVADGSLAEMACLSGKDHLDYLDLNWSSYRSMGLKDEMRKQQQQHRTAEEVIEKLHPPCYIQHLYVRAYFGRHLPNWMMAPATGAFKSLRFLTMYDLPCCNKLPDGWSQLPVLESLFIRNAPEIRRVGPEFQASSAAVGAVIVTARSGKPCSVAGFPNLANLNLEGLEEWEEWDWEEMEEDDDGTACVMAMPSLMTLRIKNCKLPCLPPGLASNRRHALRSMNLYELTNLISLENFPSVVQLDVSHCTNLKRIIDLRRLQNIRILCCPNLQVLDCVPALDSIGLQDATMATLPEYLTAVNPRYLELDCNKQLYESLMPGSSEWNKIRHIGKHNINCIEDAQTAED